MGALCTRRPLAAPPPPACPPARPPARPPTLPHPPTSLLPEPPAALDAAPLGRRRLEELGPAVGVSQPQLLDLARALLFASAQVEAAGAALAAGFGQRLEVAGAEYPGPGALGAADVEQYLRLVLPHCYPLAPDDDDVPWLAGGGAGE